MRGLTDFWRVGGPLLEATDKGGGGGASDLPETDDDIDKNESLDDGAKAVMRKERAARREAAKQAKDAETKAADAAKRLADLEAKDAERADAERKAAERAQEESGQFKELAEKRERERDEAKTALAAVEKERDALRTAADNVVKEQFDGLPAEIRALYAGGADDPVAKMDFVAKSKDAVAKLNGGTGEQGGETSRGVQTNSPNPPKGGDGGTKDERDADAAHRAANAERYRW